MITKYNPKISELPEPLKKLALQRIKEGKEKGDDLVLGRDSTDESVTLGNAFTWSSTPEGDFWAWVYNGRSWEELLRHTKCPFNDPIINETYEIF